MAIWGRYKGTGKVEQVDSGDTAYLLAEYRLAFGKDWILWRGRKKDEPRSNPQLKKYAGREGSGQFRHMTLEEAKANIDSAGHVWVLANDGSARRVKINGRTRRWKRDPDRIEVPYKYGMYEYGTFYSRDFGPSGRVLVEI